ncbi:MAG: hypothetical protein ACREMN_05310 [Gemmatimonadales bacterium]
MGCRISVVLAAALALVPAPLLGQEMPSPAEMQAQIQRIAEQRPRQAEAAARAFLTLVAKDLVPMLDAMKDGERGNEPMIFIDGVRVEGLPAGGAAADPYWMEVAQLTVQFEVVQNLQRVDSVRASLVARMFGLEAYARTLKRAYRRAGESQQAAYRKQLETLIGGHFDIENQLRLLEIKDIERRLTEVRAETQRRITKREEFIRWAVEDIIREATRPR